MKRKLKYKDFCNCEIHAIYEEKKGKLICLGFSCIPKGMKLDYPGKKIIAAKLASNV